MGIKRRYKNFVEKFLAKDKGQRYFNFYYSIGAAIVIIGALAKLEHWPYGLGNILLTIGLLTEAVIFIIAAFDTPARTYRWEDVFPVLDSRDPEDRPGFNGNGNGNGGTSIVGGIGGGTVIVNGMTGGGENISSDEARKSFGIPSYANISEEDTNALAASIKKMSSAAEQISKMAELADATQQYLDKLSGVSQNMERFSNVTNDLTEVSDTLLNSYKSITENPEGVTENTTSYVQQMHALNQNVAKLNSIYEIQIQSINSQMEAISRINSGLMRMKEMYEGSVMDSTVFKSESEKMTHHIASLNNVYARLLQAMTMNANMSMGMQGGYNQQPPYQGYNNPGYGQQGYNPNPGYNPNYPPANPTENK